MTYDNKVNLILKSFNCRGLRNKIKRQSIFRWLNDINKGICLLQETHSYEMDEKEWQLEFQGDIYYSHGTSNSKGVAILIPNSFKSELNVINISRDADGRILVLNCELEKRPIAIINIYAPTKDNTKGQADFSDVLSHLIEQNSDNTCLNPNLDKNCGSNVSYCYYKNKQIDLA